MGDGFEPASADHIDGDGLNHQVLIISLEMALNQVLIISSEMALNHQVLIISMEMALTKS